MLATVESTPRESRPTRIASRAGIRALSGELPAIDRPAPAYQAPPSMVRLASKLLCRVAVGSTHHFAIRVSDWFLAMMLTCFGLILIMHPEVFVTSKAYVLLSQMAPAANWGAVCFMIGSFRLIALMINGTFPAFRWSPHIRFMMAMLSCFVWFQVSLGITLLPVVTTALAVYPFLFLFDMYNTFLAATEAGIAERRYRDGRA